MCIALKYKTQIQTFRLSPTKRNLLEHYNMKCQKNIWVLCIKFYIDIKELFRNGSKKWTTWPTLKKVKSR